MLQIGITLLSETEGFGARVLLQFLFFLIFTTHMKVQKSSPISQVKRLQLKMIIYLTQIMYLDCVHFKPKPAYLHLLISISKPMHLLFFHSLSTLFIAKEELVQEIKETRKKSGKL